MKTTISFALMSLVTAHAAWAAGDYATPKTSAPATRPAAAKTADTTQGSQGAQGTLTMTEAEVRKVDMENRKLTLKHGEIRNLEMPGMTMVFQVADPAMLDKVKTGDKVRFAAEKIGGALTVVKIETSK